MTDHLAWPLSAIVLGIIFRRSLTQLLGRVRRLKLGEKEAELAEAKEGVQQAIEEVGKPLPEEEAERTAIYRARIKRLVQEAIVWGRKLPRTPDLFSDTAWEIEWDGDRPRLKVGTSGLDPSEADLAKSIARFKRYAIASSNPEVAAHVSIQATMYEEDLARLSEKRQAATPRAVMTRSAGSTHHRPHDRRRHPPLRTPWRS